MSGTIPSELAAKRGYSYRLTRRQFLVASSAAALAACGPAAAPNAGTASAAASAGKPLKVGQLLPFTKVYAELGNSMKRATDLYWQINEPIGEYMAQKKGVKEAFIFIADYGFGTQSAADFTTGFTKQGGKITGTLKAPLGNNGFLPFVTQLKGQATKDIYS